MSKYFLFIFLIIVSRTTLFSQGKDSVEYSGNYIIKVDSIVIIGNKITDNDVINREMNFAAGDTITPKIVSFNKERIFSLGIFTKVSLIPVRKDSLNILYILVNESWYIYPIPFAELVDRDWEKISYGMYLYIRNFRGEDETLFASAAFGYNPLINISYDRPYLFRAQNIYFNAQFSFQNAMNKSEYAKQLYGKDFDQRFISGQISFAKRINLYNKISINLGFDYIDNPIYIKGISASNQRIDHQLSLGAGYELDTRDLAQFPSTGIYALTNFYLKGLGFDGIDYQIVNIDFRNYETIFQQLILKWRFASRLTFGNLVPYHDYSFFGYGQRIRGYFNQEQEGNDSYLASFEMNYPIMKDVNMSLNFVPIVPKSLLSFRFGIYCEIFTDAGAIRMEGQSLSISNFNPGYGGGLTFLFLPYNILRLEYAFNPYHHSEMIVDIGISF